MASEPGRQRRRFSRVAFHAPAELEVSGRKLEGEALDLSLKGALIALPPESPGNPGDSCNLAVQRGLGEVVVRMTGTIIHRNEGRVGIRCDEIDLESIEHLRRLVELNLGDDELLQRELAALVSDRDP